MNLGITKNLFQTKRVKSLSIYNQTAPNTVLATFTVTRKCRSHYCEVKAINKATRALITYVHTTYPGAQLDLGQLGELLNEAGD